MAAPWFARFLGKLAKPFKNSDKRKHGRTPPRFRNFRPCLEALEDRLAPATATWIAGSGNWDNSPNWSRLPVGTIPQSGDDVMINTGAAATISIVSGDNLYAHSVTTASTDTLSFTGGGLNIGGNSTLSGPLTMTAGSLTANGS